MDNNHPSQELNDSSADSQPKPSQSLPQPPQAFQQSSPLGSEQTIYPYGQPPAPQPSRPANSCLTISVVVLILVGVAIAGIVGIGLLIGRSSGGGTGGLSLGDKIGVVRIEGVIMTGGRANPIFGGPSGSRVIVSDIRAAAKDDAIKGLVVYINSPGGSPVASDCIYRELRACAKKKPVIAVMDDVAASGGYYVACGADKIVCNGATLTGSIGVIMSGLSYYGLMDKIGLSDTTIKSGQYKDTGSPTRPMRDDERKLLKKLIMDVYNQFVDAVAEGREMKRDRVLELADGRVYTGRQAISAGLCDQQGTFYDAVDIAAKEAGIVGEPDLKYYGEGKGFLEDLLSSQLLSPLFTQRSLQNFTGPMLIEPWTYGNLMTRNISVQAVPIQMITQD